MRKWGASFQCPTKEREHVSFIRWFQHAERESASWSQVGSDGIVYSFPGATATEKDRVAKQAATGYKKRDGLAPSLVSKKFSLSWSVLFVAFFLLARSATATAGPRHGLIFLVLLRREDFLHLLVLRFPNRLGFISPFVLRHIAQFFALFSGLFEHGFNFWLLPIAVFQC